MSTCKCWQPEAAAAAAGIAAAAPGAVPPQHPVVPSKLASPCCTMQYQQAAQPQHLAAYAFA